MKRLITFAVTILTAVCLVACSVGGADKTVSSNGLRESFKAAVSISLDELNAEGTIKRFGDGMWEAEFTSPNTLSGVKLEFSDGNVTASYKGLNFSVPQSALPVKAMMSSLIAAVDEHARKDELTGEEKDGMVEISGSLDGGDYKLTVDKNGNLSSFEMPGNKLVMNFSEVTAISQEPTASSETTTAPAENSTDASAETTAGA